MDIVEYRLILCSVMTGLIGLVRTMLGSNITLEFLSNARGLQKKKKSHETIIEWNKSSCLANAGFGVLQGLLYLQINRHWSKGKIWEMWALSPNTTIVLGFISRKAKSAPSSLEIWKLVLWNRPHPTQPEWYLCSDPTRSAPLSTQVFLLGGENYLTWNSLCKKFQKPFRMNEAAFFRTDAEAALPGAWATTEVGVEGNCLPSSVAAQSWWLLVCPRFWVPLAPCPPTMQFLDPEEFLVDEEDDVFGEGKHIFLAGARLLGFGLTVWETLECFEIVKMK